MPSVSGNIIRVAARQLLDGTDEIVNVFHYTLQNTGTGGDTGLLDEIGARMSAAWVHIDQDLPNNLTTNIIDVYNVSQDYPLGQTPWGSGYTGGTASGEFLPPQVALLVLWGTATKRVQGKTYLGPMLEGNSVDGRWGGGVTTQVATWANTLRDGSPEVLDWELLLGVWSKAAGQMRPIVSRRIVNIPATLRRRRVGRGS